MDTTLFEVLKKALAVGGELDSDIEDDVMFEMLRIIADNDNCKNELGEDQMHDAADYAFNVFLVSWRNIVKKVNNEEDFHSKLKKLCITACLIVRRRPDDSFGRTMGVVPI